MENILKNLAEQLKKELSQKFSCDGKLFEKLGIEGDRGMFLIKHTIGMYVDEMATDNKIRKSVVEIMFESRNICTSGSEDMLVCYVSGAIHIAVKQKN